MAENNDFQIVGLSLHDIKIQVKIIENRDLKAIVGLDFGDFVVKGFRVMKSNYENESNPGHWIIAPSYKDSGGRFHPIFFIPNKEQWKELEDRIQHAYEKAVDEHYKKRFKLDKDANIPFA